MLEMELKTILTINHSIHGGTCDSANSLPSTVLTSVSLAWRSVYQLSLEGCYLAASNQHVLRTLFLFPSIEGSEPG